VQLAIKILHISEVDITFLYYTNENNTVRKTGHLHSHNIHTCRSFREQQNSSITVQTKIHSAHETYKNNNVEILK